MRLRSESVSSQKREREEANARALAIRRRSKVGVVRARAVLRVGLNSVVAESSASKVVVLEVARSLVKAVAV